MEQIIRMGEFAVTEWEYHPLRTDVTMQVKVKKQVIFSDLAHTIIEKPTDRLWEFTWGIEMLYHDNAMMFLYMAVDLFFVKDYLNTQVDYLKKILELSYSSFTTEFEKRRKNTGLDSDLLKPFEKLGIELQPLLDHLKE